MNPSPIPFDEFLKCISTLPPEAQTEMVLRYFAHEVGKMDQSLVKGTRAHLLRVLPDDAHRQSLIDLIDGNLALRDISPDRA